MEVAPGETVVPPGETTPEGTTPLGVEAPGETAPLGVEIAPGELVPFAPGQIHFLEVWRVRYNYCIFLATKYAHSVCAIYFFMHGFHDQKAKVVAYSGYTAYYYPIVLNYIIIL